MLVTTDQIGHFLKPLDVFGNTPNLRVGFWNLPIIIKGCTISFVLLDTIYLSYASSSSYQGSSIKKKRFIPRKKGKVWSSCFSSVFFSATFSSPFVFYFSLISIFLHTHFFTFCLLSSFNTSLSNSMFHILHT